ncbi:unnamed protein product [Nezara viridula]|uniref:Neuropeptide n=1 Tax=Nezara viridula TaxID=85310 RepID=A0A9P0MIW8_NEZVI|nr:unnamed protein product [Nezara viridula]
MQIKFYQLFFFVICQLYEVGHSFAVQDNESFLSDRPKTQESSSEFVLMTQDKVELERLCTERSSKTDCSQIIKNIDEKKGNPGIFMRTINVFTNICYSDITYDLFGDLIPLKRIKRNSKPQIIYKKKKSVKACSEDPVLKNISYININTSPTKLKLKHTSLPDETNKNRLNYDIQESTFEKHELTLNSLNNKIDIANPESVDSKTRKETNEDVIVNNVAVPEKCIIVLGNENTSITRKEECATYSQKDSNRPNYLHRNPDLKLKKKGFIYESSEKAHEGITDTDVPLKEEGTTCSQNVCSRQKHLKNNPDLEFEKKGFVQESSHEAMNIANVLGLDASVTKEVDGTTCSKNVFCVCSKLSKLQKKNQYEEEEQTFNYGSKKMNNDYVEEKTWQSEYYMNILVENFEGIRYVLLERQKQLNKEPMTYYNLLKNISSLIEKIDLLKNKIETLNISLIENNILTPDEEALITGSKLKINEVDINNNKEEESSMKFEYRYMSDGNKKFVFSSAWSQCVVCITVANKLQEAFNAILNNLDFKDIPPTYLNLGDDWCFNFSLSSSFPTTNEFQHNWSNLLNEEEMDIEYQLDFENEFTKKCDLYRSLISDEHLYRHWLRNNNDMVKTIFFSDYTIEFKSCSPFVL